MTQVDFYAFLEVPRDASADEIQRAFREKALLLHPDKNKDNPNAARDFKMLTQAYQILSNTDKRKQYDATLPPPIIDAKGSMDLHAIWQTVGELFFERADRYTPAVEALRSSVPLLLEEEDNLLVLGIESTKSNLIGYLNASVTRTAVRSLLREVSGRPWDFRMIPGLSEQDWLIVKETEARIKKRRESAADPLTTLLDKHAPTTIAEEAPGNGVTANPEQNWDDVMESFSRQWSTTSNRNFAQTRGRFVLDQLPLLARSEDLSRAVGMPEEALQRSLARALDRLENLTNIDGGVIALQYLNYRARLLGGVR